MPSPEVQAYQKEMKRLYTLHRNNRNELELDKLVLLAKIHPNDRQEVLNYCMEMEQALGFEPMSGGIAMAGSIM
jgi:hypothetical protein